MVHEGGPHLGRGEIKMAKKKVITAQQVVGYLNNTGGKATKDEVIEHFNKNGIEITKNHISGVCWDKNGPLGTDKVYVFLKDSTPVEVKSDQEPEPERIITPEFFDEKLLMNFIKFGEADGLPVYKHAAKDLFLDIKDDGFSAKYVFRDGERISAEPNKSLREAIGLLIEEIYEARSDLHAQQAIAFLNRLKRKL